MKLSLTEEKEYEEAKKKIDEALTIRSRTFLGLCKNNTCYNLRRNNSAYCQICADKSKTKTK
jgi:recombinational DNA repair protein RecR